MQRKKDTRQNLIENLRRFYDQSTRFDQEELTSGNEMTAFSECVSEEVNWIQEHNVLGAWGMKKADIQYDPKEFGKRCKEARVARGYTQKEVAKQLLCNTHGYISGIENGKVKVDILALEALSLLYHKLPLYLLGFEDNKLLNHAIFLANHPQDKWQRLILNILLDPDSLGLSVEQPLEQQLAYINAVTKLALLPDYIANNLMKIAEIIPLLIQCKKQELEEQSPFLSTALPVNIIHHSDLRQAWCGAQEVLTRLSAHNPEWLIFLAKVFMKRPEWIVLLTQIAENGGYSLYKQNAEK